VAMSFQSKEITSLVPAHVCVCVYVWYYKYSLHEYEEFRAFREGLH
jgi:hypothetical protein